MKFYTKKGKKIVCALMSALGAGLFVGIVVFLVAGSIFKVEQRFVPRSEVEQFIGAEPETADYENGYLNEDYKRDYAEYLAQVDAEIQKRQAVLNIELALLFRKKLLIAVGFALLAAIPSGIVSYRGMVDVLEIEGETVRFTYASGRKKELHIDKNQVVYSIARVISRSNLYIPQYVHQFHYMTLKGNRQRRDAEVVYVSREDGVAINGCFAARQ